MYICKIASIPTTTKATTKNRKLKCFSDKAIYFHNLVKRGIRDALHAKHNVTYLLHMPHSHI